jgi:XapX domain-containing protein
MRQFSTSLAIGIGVGVIYGLLRFRSPAPPMIALVGLFGMLLGEQAVSAVRARFEPASAAVRGPEDDASPPGKR